MATRLKPSRINVDNTPRVGDGAAYQNDDDFHWSVGGGDMSYEDFEWHTLTGNSITIEDISNNITPSSNFTVSAGTELKPGIEYVLRVNTGSTPYTMTLGTGITNPNGYSTTLEPNTINQFKFMATSESQLELEGTAGGGMTVLSYGNSTWNDFISAYNKNAIVYCRASSNSNPATGAQNRLAFMAYVNSASSPTEVEFQYYRSRSSHGSDANQQDEVYVYKLTNASGGTWTVEIRNTAAKIATGTGLTKEYTTSGVNSTLTIANDGVLTVNGEKGTVTVNDIKQSATAPANPTAGTAWYDTTNGALKVYNGSAWDTIATGGAISDTAYGPGWDGQTTTAPSQNAVYDKINSIDTLIPSEATSSNKLADKAFVGDSINSVTAYYITKNANGDQFATYAELAAATTFYSGGVVRVPTMNDYTIVLDDENHDHATTRYIYNSGWEYQYTINETPLTQAQLNALNSGITAGKVSTYDGYATSKQDKLVNQSNIKSINNNSLLGNGNLTLNDVKASATAPSSPTEGMVWYDTTNDVLKSYDGTSWNECGKESNVKYFYIHNPIVYQQDAIADVQAIWDWYHAGARRTILAQCIDGFLTNIGYDTGTHVFTLTGRGYGPEDGGSESAMTYVTLTCPTDGNGVVQSVTYTAASYPYLSTNYDYFTPYTPLYDGSPATKKYVDDHAASYEAGPGIALGTGHRDTQGPCDDGYHIATRTEWNVLCGILFNHFGIAKHSSVFPTYLKMPLAGYRDFEGDFYDNGYGEYWSANSVDSPYASYALIARGTVVDFELYDKTSGMNIRPFKDNPVIPADTSVLPAGWTKTDFSSSTGIPGTGIYYNTTLGIISLNPDGVNWLTIADKNLGATAVYNYGDTLTDANCGKFYQWGNNYGFSRSGTITKSSSMVDASSYGPGNYYSSSTYINDTDQWDSSDNRNLWGGVTDGVWVDNEGSQIVNTGVLSVNGNTGNVVVGEFSPSNYGTSGNILTKTPSGYQWAAPSGGDVKVSSQPNNILTSGMKIWAGTQTNYDNLGTYDNNTVYLTIE